MSVVFVVSYLFLIRIVVVLILAVLGLYRMVVEGRAGVDGRPFSWPLLQSGVGSPTPWSVSGPETAFTVIVGEEVELTRRWRPRSGGKSVAR